MTYGSSHMSWPIVPLGSVARVVGGSTPDSGNTSYWGDDIVWVTPADLGQLETIHVRDSGRRITRLGFLSTSIDMLPVNSVILSSRAPIGYLAINDVPLCTNQGCKSFVPGASLDTRYLFYFLKRAVPALRELGSGATFAEVSKSKLENYPIPVPPLPEQQRIVAKLDEQMSALDRAEQALAEQQAAASAFTTVALQQVFSGSESGRWPQVRLGEVAASDLTQVPPDDEFAKDLPYIGMEDIESQTGRIIAQSAHSDVRSNTFAFDERHVLYGKLRPYLNKVALPESRGRCSTELIPLRPEARLDRRYLAWFLRRPETVSAAMQEKTGSRMPRASMKNIGQLHIPLPPLSHQRQVVASLERISAELTSLQQHFADQRTDLAVLRSSLLNAAFSGEV